MFVEISLLDPNSLELSLNQVIEVAKICRARTVSLVFGSRQLFLKIHDLFDLHQEPAVNFREVEYLFNGEAGAQGVAVNFHFAPFALRLRAAR